MSGYYKGNQRDSIWTEHKFYGGRVSEGRYSDGIKSGEWMYYNLNSLEELPRAKGIYQNDVRTGLWNFYDHKGKLVQKFDFDKNKLIGVDSSEFKHQYYIQGGKYGGVIYVDEMAVFKNGPSDFLSFLSQNLNYPDDAKLNNIEGRVYVSFLVGRDGVISDYKIVKSLDENCDNEVIRFMNSTSGMWNPAMLEGEKVVVRMFTPISFSLR